MLDLAQQNRPQSPGVYRFYNQEGVLLYVGKSINIAQRVRSHFQASQHQAKEGIPASFDLDTYFILQNALKKPGALLYGWQEQRLSPLSDLSPSVD